MKIRVITRTEKKVYFTAQEITNILVEKAGLIGEFPHVTFEFTETEIIGATVIVVTEEIKEEDDVE